MNGPIPYPWWMANVPNFGERLKKARELAKLTQDQFGTLLDPAVSKQAVSSWENNRNDPPSKAVRVLCERSRLSADYLLLGKLPSTLEDQLLMMFRGLNEEMQDALLAQANAAYNLLHPGPSISDPFPARSKIRK